LLIKWRRRRIRIGRQEFERKLEGTWGLSGIGMSMTLKRMYGKNPNDPRTRLRHLVAREIQSKFCTERPGFATLWLRRHFLCGGRFEGIPLFIGDPAAVRLEIEAKLPAENLILYGYPNEQGVLSKD